MIDDIRALSPRLTTIRHRALMSARLSGSSVAAASSWPGSTVKRDALGSVIAAGQRKSVPPSRQAAGDPVRVCSGSRSARRLTRGPVMTPRPSTNALLSSTRATPAAREPSPTPTRRRAVAHRRRLPLAIVATAPSSTVRRTPHDIGRARGNAGSQTAATSAADQKVVASRCASSASQTSASTDWSVLSAHRRARGDSIVLTTELWRSRDESLTRDNRLHCHGPDPSSPVRHDDLNLPARHEPAT